MKLEPLKERQFAADWEVRKMTHDRIARILFNMSLDMDWEDSEEFAETEISCIEKEMEVLKENKCDSLLQALEIIAMQNEDMEFWKEKQKT